MTEQTVLRYPWWAFFLAAALTAASLYTTSQGNWLLSAGWDWPDRYALISVGVVVNLGAVALGYVAATNWQNGAKQVAVISLVFAIVVGVFSGIGTLRALTHLLAVNEETLVTEQATEARGALVVETSQRRIQQIGARVRQFERIYQQAVSATAEAVAKERHPRACGTADQPATVGPICAGAREATAQAREAESSALAALQAAQDRLAAENATLDDRLTETAPIMASDGALIAANTSELERAVTIWLGALCIEMLPFLSGWLFGIREKGAAQQAVNVMVDASEAMQAQTDQLMALLKAELAERRPPVLGPQQEDLRARLSAMGLRKDGEPKPEPRPREFERAAWFEGPEDEDVGSFASRTRQRASPTTRPGQVNGALPAPAEKSDADDDPTRPPQLDA